MKDLGNWALDNRKLIYFLVAVLTIGGVFAYYDMSKLEDPEIKVKQAAVVTVYPGASAHQVELEVTDVLEKSIRSMKDIGEVTSRSMNDMSLINVSLSTLVTNEETEQCWDILRRKVADVQAELPEGASVSVVMDDFGDVFGMFYAMTFDGYTDAEAARYAELVKKEVMKIEGISKVNIYGQRPECIYIELYEDKLANLGVHPAEVLATLNGQNKTVYSGYYESGGSRLRVTVNDRYRTTEDIGSLLLQGHEDDQLRLRNIASVTEGYENPVRNELRYDGRRALGISISALSGTDITKIGRQVERTLERLENERMPAGMEIHEVFFQPEKVEAALDSFLINLVESVLIVVVLLMFAMGFRSGVILGFNLLVTVLGSLMILNVFDGSLQRVSLASFVLAMGMLVDNAIVILDGIQVDMQRGIERRTALTGIGRKTAMPLLGATLIAILAFFPIFLSPDTAGIYVRDLFIVLAVSLLLSWILALTLVPVLADKRLKVKGNREGDPYGNRYYRAQRTELGAVSPHRLALRRVRSGRRQPALFPHPAAGFLSGYGLRPALYRVQTAGRDQQHTGRRRPARHRELSAGTQRNHPRHDLDRRHAQPVQPRAEHRRPVAGLWRTDSGLHLARGTDGLFRRNTDVPQRQLSGRLRAVETLQPDVQEIPD